MNSLLLVVFSVFFITCLFNEEKQAEASKSVGRIIGGAEANAGQFPYIAAINVQTATSKFFCGGTLITNDWIITSGFCVYGAILFTIQLGSTSLEGDDSERIHLATSEYVLHPDFNPNTLEHDIGLIELREPILFTDYIKTALLPFMTLYNDTPVFAVGWGQTSDTEAGLSNSLQFVKGSIMSNVQCRVFYGSAIAETMTCFEGNYNEGACTGDVGGPLIERQEVWHWVVGVASFISGNGCESIEPSGYTKVFDYNSWIMDVTGYH